MAVARTGRPWPTSRSAYCRTLFRQIAFHVPEVVIERGAQRPLAETARRAADGIGASDQLLGN